jgi:2-oxoglutarate/2-oxoacid ferredoxin oxidoreductase subunit alpha
MEASVGLEFIDGNEAIARAAIRAGCNFFAGYPITPASTILSNMMQLLPESGGIAVQAEDEIASIGFCIGAAMAGSKAMTATSGPGISLYSENIGLAIMGETPLVIVDVQRQGPATGSATKGADGDIQFVRWITSGGLPIIALCPATVAEAYELTYRAFSLAESYRTPVFVMSNKEVSMTCEAVDLDMINLPPPKSRRRPLAGETYSPHQFGQIEEVPPLADIGDGHVTRYTTSTHNKAGYLTAEPEVIQEMVDHYAAKINSVANDIALYHEDLQESAETLVVSYGVTSRAASIAVRQARNNGHKVSSLILQTLYPVPERIVRQAMQGVRRVVVPEMNLGQYRYDIERLAPAGVAVSGVNRMDTTLLSPSEIEFRGEL